MAGSTMTTSRKPADGGAQPIDDAGISRDPVRIAAARDGVVSNVVVEAELGEDRVEEAAPLTVDGIVVEVQDDGHVGAGAHRLQRSRRNGAGG